VRDEDGAEADADDDEFGETPRMLTRTRTMVSAMATTPRSRVPRSMRPSWTNVML
jgi:hypothetical protein